MEQLVNGLRDELTNITESFSIFQDQIRNQDVVIFVGNTRGGKSTVINYLIGTQLQAFDNGWHQYKIEKVNESAEGPSIGQGTLSTTTNLEIYPNNNSNVIYIDVAGFGDNRGRIQDIRNSLFLRQISYARTCKFVLVSDVCNIMNDNIQEFVNLIQTMCKFIPCSSLCNSVSLLITKIDHQWKTSEIAHLLDEKILQTDINIHNDELQLVRHFVTHDNVIALFRTPLQEGKITAILDVNIGNAISNCSPLDMNNTDIRITVSTESRLAILEISTNINDELNFIQVLNETIMQYQNYFDIQDYVFASTDEELNEVKHFMVELKNKLIYEKNVTHSNFQEILDSITYLISVDTPRDFNNSFNFLIILEDVALITQSIKASIIHKYRLSLNNVIIQIGELLNKINDEETDRTSMGNLATITNAIANVAGSVAGVLSAASTSGAVISAATPAASTGAATAAVGSALEVIAGTSAMGAGVAGAASSTGAATAAVGSALEAIAGTSAVSAGTIGAGTIAMAGAPVAAVIAITGAVMVAYSQNARNEDRRRARQRQGR